jgi:hypothetical protein
MNNKKVLRLICVVLVQIAILDIVLGFLVIKKASGSKNAAKENSVEHSSGTSVQQSTLREAKVSQVKSRELIYKSVEERIASLVYKKPVTLYYSNPDSVNNISLFKRNFLSLIYSKPFRSIAIVDVAIVTMVPSTAAKNVARVSAIVKYVFFFFIISSPLFRMLLS